MVERVVEKLSGLLLWLTRYVGEPLGGLQAVLLEIVHDALAAFNAASHADCREVLVKLRDLCEAGLKLLPGEPGSE